MPSAQSTDPRLDQARDLIRDKGLSPKDIQLLEEILREGGGALFPPAQATRPVEPAQLARLKRTFGLFLVFLNQFTDQHLGETRAAMGLVLQHSLAGLGEAAAAAHREMLAQNREPGWTIQILDLIAALRTMATALGSESPEGPQLKDHWTAFLLDGKDHFRALFAQLGTSERGPALVAKLNTQMKALNRTLQSG
jgi:hypothetical protein